MSYTILVTEQKESINGAEPVTIERYRQTVDELSLPRLISAINAQPRKARTPKPEKRVKVAP